jgi:tetratricopeptide (TPR) repeat protein
VRILRSHVLLSIAAAAVAVSLSAQQAQDSPYKDMDEYNLVQEINKAADPKKKVELLNSWVTKYPESKLKWERMGAMLGACQSAGDAPCMKKTALEMIQLKPKEAVGYSYVCLLTLSMQDKSEGALADGEKAANGLLELLPSLAKPANATDAQFDQSKKDSTALAHKVLGWVKMSRNDFPNAEKSFLDSLRANPNDATVSMWTGQMVQKQQDQTKQALIVWHFCRAGHYTGAQGALPPATAQQLQGICKKNYVLLRDVEAGLQDFINRAVKEVIPPAEGVTIVSKEEEDAKAYNEIVKNNPDLAVWMNTKKELEKEGGEAYFGKEMKGTLFKNKGKIISHKPEEKPTEIVVGLLDGTKAEMTLMLSGPLPGKADPGTEITFEGVPTAFTKDPFNVTLEVEREKVGGWPDKGPMPPITAPRKPVVGKKPVAPVKRPVMKKK